MESQKFKNNQEGSFSSEIEVMVPNPSETKVAIGEKHFSFATYDIGESKEDPNPGVMQTGKWEDVLNLYKNNPYLISGPGKGKYDAVPYSWLLGEGTKTFGNYATPEGQDEFANSDLVLTDGLYDPPEFAKSLWRFSRLKQARAFELDETVACLRGLKATKGKLVFTVGGGKYSDAFYSMGSEGETISLNDAERDALKNEKKASVEHMAELEELLAQLSREHGEGVSLRDVIFKRYGGLPHFNEQVYNSILGVAGTVLTKDGDYVFVRRGKNVSVNLGMNVTASGGVSFDREAFSRYGLPYQLGAEMHREAKEEIGVRSGVLLLGAIKERMRLELGIDNEEDYDLIPVGFARELPRGGSPEAMFLIRYKGSTKDLIATAMNNHNKEKREIDEFIYTMPAAEATDLIKTPGASSVLQHKGVLNLMLIDEYLRNS